MMHRITRITRCSAAANRSAAVTRLPEKRCLSSPESSWARAATRKNDTRKWNMLRKQEHIYATMFSSGEVTVENHGTPEVADALVEALRLQWAYGHPYVPKGFPLLTHAFHAYPAGMQPAAARHLLETVLPGTSVLDPFVGGGTVVLEAMREGRVAVGSDISPLALFVSRGRCWTPSDDELDRLRDAARSIASAASVKLCIGTSRPASGADWEVVKAAIGDYLANEETWPGLEVERALWFVFAVARSRGAKARRRRPTNGRPPVVADRYFQSVCTEYAGAIAGLTRATTAASAPSSPPHALFVHRDARQPVPPHPATTQQLAADLEEAARVGVKDTATKTFAAEANKAERERIAAAAASSVPIREIAPRREGLEVEEREGLPMGDSSAAGEVGNSAAGEIGDGAAGEIGDSSATGVVRDSTAAGVESIPAGMVFDAVLTSPPYPGVYDYLGHARSARSQLGALPRPNNLKTSRPVDASGRRPGGRLADAVVDGNDDDLATCEGMGRTEIDLADCQGQGGTEFNLAACKGGVSVFIDSAVPSGRDWPSNWTDGEIGAKSDVRRRARRNTAFSGVNSTESDQGVSLGEARLQAGKGGESPGLGRKWADDQKEWLMATTRVLRSGGGRMAVMVGDGDGVDTRSSLVEGVEELGRLGAGEGGLGLRVVGWATLRAARDARRSMRTEHLILLEKS